MIKWLKNNDFDLTQAARSKLYIALTRARHSVAIVINNKDLKVIKGIGTYNPDS